MARSDGNSLAAAFSTGESWAKATRAKRSEIKRDAEVFMIGISADFRVCHVEGSRDISKYFPVKLKPEMARDSSTSLGMTENWITNGIRKKRNPVRRRPNATDRGG